MSQDRPQGRAELFNELDAYVEKLTRINQEAYRRSGGRYRGLPDWTPEEVAWRSAEKQKLEELRKRLQVKPKEFEQFMVQAAKRFLAKFEAEEEQRKKEDDELRRLAIKTEPA